MDILGTARFRPISNNLVERRTFRCYVANGDVQGIIIGGNTMMSCVQSHLMDSWRHWNSKYLSRFSSISPPIMTTRPSMIVYRAFFYVECRVSVCHWIFLKIPMRSLRHPQHIDICVWIIIPIYVNYCSTSCI